jgi:hypothetical protein
MLHHANCQSSLQKLSLGSGTESCALILTLIATSACLLSRPWRRLALSPGQLWEKF